MSVECTPRLTVLRLILYRRHIVLMSLIFCNVILSSAYPASFIAELLLAFFLHQNSSVSMPAVLFGTRNWAKMTDVSWYDWKLMPSIEIHPQMLEIWSATIHIPKKPIDEVCDETATSGWLIHGTRHWSQLIFWLDKSIVKFWYG